MAAKDLQMARTRAIRVDEVPGAAIASERHSSVEPTAFLLGVLRRQWPLLLVAVIASVSIAWLVSLEFRTQTYSVELDLKPQQLPVSNQKVYTPPNADVASDLLTSIEVLQPVVEKHGLPPVLYFSRFLTTKLNAKSGIITVNLTHGEKPVAALILNDIGDEFVKAIVEQRKQMLGQHADHIGGLLDKADGELNLARVEFVKLKESEQSTVNDARQTAELEGLIDRSMQVEAAIGEVSRDQARIQRNQAVVNEDMVSIRNSICRDVLAGRKRQTEIIGQGLTGSSRLATVKEEVQQQLTTLEAELDSILSQPNGSEKNAENSGSGSDVVAENSPTETTQAAQPSGEAAGVSQNNASDNSPQVSEVSLTSQPSTSPLGESDFASNWIQKVAGVGRESLGDFDQPTLDAIQKAQDKLSKLAEDARKLQFDLDDSKAELAFFIEKDKELLTAIKTSVPVTQGRMSERALELESDLAFKEQKFAELSRQLDQINQIRECQVSDYVVQSPAAPVLDGEKSDRKKLFALTMLGGGIILLIPSTLIEMLRLRPTPIDVVSQKWNLPVLGVQVPARHRKNSANARSSDFQNEFRLMALRIQQSLYRPKGRVVLFSGLDHDESPMGLIRSLAKCFSQREESVLIIQTLPTLSDSTVTKSGRPGVAEFLAGHYDDPTELVVGTGLTGIGFLPGGSAVGASEAMASSRLTALIDQFRESYSMILLCGPSTFHPVDLQMLAARADGIVFTVNKQSLRTVYGDEVIGDLIELGGPILGFAEHPVTSKKAYPADQFQPDTDLKSESPRVTSISA
jgi:hypothetical protein